MNHSLFAEWHHPSIDNIAPPIASCLGDLITLLLLGAVSTILINFVHTPIPSVLVILTLLFIATCLTMARRNPHVKDLLTQGWSPLFGAMVISSGSGIVLDMFVSRYEGFAILAVAISGITIPHFHIRWFGAHHIASTGLSGGAGSILVSRLSTALHAGTVGTVDLPQAQASPRLVIVTLMLITLPIEILFLTMLRAFGWLELPFLFGFLALIFFCSAVRPCTILSYHLLTTTPIQVFVSLLVARALTNFLWSRGLDPDIYALPIHSALMDLSGQLQLVLCYELASTVGMRVVSQPH
jgi:solute carrier family 41